MGSKFDRGLSRITDLVEKVKFEIGLSDLEVRDILELVKSDYMKGK